MAARLGALRGRCVSAVREGTLAGRRVHTPASTQRQRCAPLRRCFAAATSTDGLKAGTGQNSKTDWDIKMLYDGEPAHHKVNMLRRRDEGQHRICFVDIASPDYTAADNAGVSFEQAMGEIHAVLPDGTVVKNIEVFKRLYDAVGLGWVYAFTQVEPLRKAADAVYGVWARYRLPITGREDLSTILKRREEKTCR